ncbi:hypothetical protein EES37_18080 [Streptomyces sp. ADI91-18]|nr:hypothetical protein EES37_18080 [Streptomyces sp. ADI91-18]
MVSSSAYSAKRIGSSVERGSQPEPETLMVRCPVFSWRARLVSIPCHFPSSPRKLTGLL